MITDSATTGCGLDWFWRHPISQQSEGYRNIMESWKAGVGIGARLVSSERYGEAIRGGGGGGAEQGSVVVRKEGSSGRAVMVQYCTVLSAVAKAAGVLVPVPEMKGGDKHATPCARPASGLEIQWPSKASTA